MTRRIRWLLIGAALVVLLVASTGYVLSLRSPADGATAVSADISLNAKGRILFRDARPGPTFGRIATVPIANPGSERTVGDMLCERIYAVHTTGVCVQRGGLVPTTFITVVDAQLKAKQEVKSVGFPNRARISASGAMVSATMFVQGDSYATDDFSTRTSIVDTRTGKVIQDVEQIPMTLNGAEFHSIDANYWGVSFATDDNTFYMTLRTQGQTYLVKGDYAKWSAHAIRENVECPSLSPNDTRIAFKKRVSPGPDNPWRLYVLDLTTMQETELAETRSIDDQVVWLNDSTLMYGVPRQGGGWDIWSVPADGSGKATVLIKNAMSPSALQ